MKVVVKRFINYFNLKLRNKGLYTYKPHNFFFTYILLSILYIRTRITYTISLSSSDYLN